MRVEAGGYQHQLRFGGFDGRQPISFQRLAEGRAVAARWQWRVDDVGAIHRLQPVGIVRVLEAGADQNAGIVHEGRNGAVAVMDIEIEDRHAPRNAAGEGVRCRHRHAVQQAEAHRRGRLGVVSRRPNGAEGPPLRAGGYGIDCRYRGAGCQLRRLQGVRTEGGVRIQLHQAGGRRQLFERIQIASVVDAGQQWTSGCRRTALV